MKVYLIVTYLSLFPSGDIQSQAYWYVEVHNMKQCVHMRDEGIDFGSVTSSVPDFIEGRYVTQCVESFDEQDDEHHND